MLAHDAARVHPRAEPVQGVVQAHLDAGEHQVLRHDAPGPDQFLGLSQVPLHHGRVAEVQPLPVPFRLGRIHRPVEVLGELDERLAAGLSRAPNMAWRFSRSAWKAAESRGPGYRNTSRMLATNAGSRYLTHPKSTRPMAEWQANYVAAALMMPQATVPETVRARQWCGGVRQSAALAL